MNDGGRLCWELGGHGHEVIFEPITRAVLKSAVTRIPKTSSPLALGLETTYATQNEQVYVYLALMTQNIGTNSIYIFNCSSLNQDSLIFPLNKFYNIDHPYFKFPSIGPVKFTNISSRNLNKVQ